MIPHLAELGNFTAAAVNTADATWILVMGGLAILVAIIRWIAGLVEKGGRYDALKPRLDTVDAAEREVAKKTGLLDQREKAILVLSKEKAIGFPWLANAYAEFFYLEEMKIAHGLDKKSHPAHKAAEKVRDAAHRRRDAERAARILKFQIAFYEALFPWLEELKSEETEDELIRIQSGHDGEVHDDPVRRWLTPEEYRQLPPREKNQRALDRYWKRKKTKWEIGRDFERFVGWEYESKGWTVRYQGIVEGFDDLGRDLIVSKDGDVHIVQCKYWSREKTIHEKHVFQLYGTMIAFKMEHPFVNVEGHFVTSASLSDRARRFAEHLGIRVVESAALQSYPCIKCNISRQSGERIYHLPFDQQYDTTVIEPGRGEFFAASVAEAEDKGFRRALRYRG